MAEAMPRISTTRPPIVQAARARALTMQAAHRASHARRELAVVVPLIAVVLLAFLIAAVFVALRIAGLDPRALAISGAIAAVVFGLAAQQTLGNLIAGVVLLAVRPFASATACACSRAASRGRWRGSCRRSACSTPRSPAARTR
jgi:hypothetical protein